MNLPTRRLAIVAVAAMLASCSGGILGGGGPGPTLYTLQPLAEFPSGLPQLKAQLLVDIPSASDSLNTRKIALRRNTLNFDYFADANWTDSAPALVQALLVESFERSGRVTAVSRETLALRGDVLLRPELRHFEADYGNNESIPTVRVEIGLMLVRSADRSIVGTHTASASAKPKENQTGAVVAAFDMATREALRDAIVWTLGAVK